MSDYSYYEASIHNLVEEVYMIAVEKECCLYNQEDKDVYLCYARSDIKKELEKIRQENEEIYQKYLKEKYIPSKIVNRKIVKGDEIIGEMG